MWKDFSLNLEKIKLTKTIALITQVKQGIYWCCWLVESAPQRLLNISEQPRLSFPSHHLSQPIEMSTLCKCSDWWGMGAGSHRPLASLPSGAPWHSVCGSGLSPGQAPLLQWEPCCPLGGRLPCSGTARPRVPGPSVSRWGWPRASATWEPQTQFLKGGRKQLPCWGLDRVAGLKPGWPREGSSVISAFSDSGFLGWQVGRWRRCWVRGCWEVLWAMTEGWRQQKPIQPGSEWGALKGRLWQGRQVTWLL